MTIALAEPTTPTDLAEQALAGETLSRDDALAVLNTPDSELLPLLHAAYRIRREHFGNTVQLYYLKNAKSGLCPEDCHYCSQSAISDSPIDKYPLQSTERLLAGAREAAANKARTYCIVASGRGPSNREVGHIAETVKQIKDETGLHICCCLGILNDDQAAELKAAGLIVGMGEEADDVIDVALALRELEVESIPVNFLNAIDGTPLEGSERLDPRYCLKVLCLFRFANPTTEIRIAGGREVNLRSLQPLGLYPANSLFVSDYLTTKGQEASADYRMIEDLGFEIIEQPTNNGTM